MRNLTILTLIISVLFFTNCRKPENIKAKFTIPDFTYVENCNPVIFDNRSKAANTYLWDFGDGTTSTEKNPVHVYEKAGIYTVSLIAMNDDFENETMEDVTISTPSTFQKIDGAFLQHDVYNDLILESDNSLVVGATLFSKANLIKFNSDGKRLWRESFDDVFTGVNSSCNAVVKTFDQGYLMVGAIVSGEMGNDKYVIKTDLGGNLLWESTYGGSNEDGANAVTETEDGDYIVVGYTIDNDNYNTYISKIDTGGNLLWERAIDIYGNDEAHAIAKTGNDSYIISGSYSNAGTGFNTGIFVLEIDNEANVKWQRIYDNISYSNEIIVEYGAYVIAGHTDPIKNSDTDIYLLKINQLGDLEWEKTYPKTGEDKAYSIGKSTDGGYVITGVSANEQRGDADAFLLKVDSQGDKMFYKTYGSSDFDTGSAVKATGECGFVITGRSKTNPSNYLLLKTDSEGNL